MGNNRAICRALKQDFKSVLFIIPGKSSNVSELHMECYDNLINMSDKSMVPKLLGCNY